MNSNCDTFVLDYVRSKTNARDVSVIYKQDGDGSCLYKVKAEGSIWVLLAEDEDTLRVLDVVGKYSGITPIFGLLFSLTFLVILTIYFCLIR